MTHRTRLREALEGLATWEQRKRRENFLVEALVYALVVSLVLVPFRQWLPGFLTPLLLAPVSFALIAGVLFFNRRTHAERFLATLNQLDHKLHLEERAVTAWEILQRGGERPWERFVLEEAWARLEGVNLPALFRRRLSWFAYAAPVLLIVVLLTPWFSGPTASQEPSGVATLAQQIKELAAQLKKRGAGQEPR